MAVKQLRLLRPLPALLLSTASLHQPVLVRLPLSLPRPALRLLLTPIQPVTQGIAGRLMQQIARMTVHLLRVRKRQPQWLRQLSLCLEPRNAG